MPMLHQHDVTGLSMLAMLQPTSHAVKRGCDKGVLVMHELLHIYWLLSNTSSILLQTRTDVDTPTVNVSKSKC